jgi:hypothetical protein
MKSILIKKIRTCHDELIATGYEGKQEAVRTLVEETREMLTGPGGIGKWETAELQIAESALAANWLGYALACADKAITVSRLPPEEYEFGFNYGKPKSTGQ